MKNHVVENTVFESSLRENVKAVENNKLRLTENSIHKTRVFATSPIE